MSRRSSVSITNLLSKGHTLVLIGEASKGVRVLDGAYVPEASIKLRSPKTHVKAELKQLTRLAGNSTSVSSKVSVP
jgi:hypothetical protein